MKNKCMTKGFAQALLFLLLTVSLACQQESPEHNQKTKIESTSNVVAIDATPMTTSAATVRVVTSGGFSAAYSVLKEQAEKDLHITLETEYGSSSGGAPDSIPMRLQRNESFDIIILSRSSLDQLTKDGYVVPESRVDLVRSNIGMAVKEGAKKPDISTVEAFTRSLMDAKSIGYSASASGTYLSTVLWPQMDIWTSIQGKSKRILSERVATVVARGEVEIGFQQISEILPIAGVDFVGPIPAELQKVTTFAMGRVVKSANPKDAERLIAYLSSVNVADQIKSTGLDPVVLEIGEPVLSETQRQGAPL
ncbi:MAG: substrate-binding domain-containing protein [Spongiibacteraceae bacterium]|nr:substrate-binding domain-containing protein [Spongiibacteraceae bacterium]